MNVKRITFTSLMLSDGKFPYDWSPDGNMISYYSISPEGDETRASIFTTDADGNSQRSILEEPGEFDWSPSFSPSGQGVIFSSDRGGNRDIYTVGVDGRNLRQITFSENHEFNPDWSPDGRQIAYTSERDGNSQIYLLDIQSGDERRITSGLADNGLPRFSPNGEEIAYHSRIGDISELFVLDLATLESRQITRFGKSASGASWSPDAKFIYFQMNEIGEDTEPDIYRISPDGGFPEAIIQSEGYDGDVVVSPFIER